MEKGYNQDFLAHLPLQNDGTELLKSYSAQETCFLQSTEAEIATVILGVMILDSRGIEQGFLHDESNFILYFGPQCSSVQNKGKKYQNSCLKRIVKFPQSVLV